ncbi:hypothetical protein [Leptodesmis sp.]
MEPAKELLKQSELTVTEIALECGFTHQSHFDKSLINEQSGHLDFDG